MSDSVAVQQLVGAAGASVILVVVFSKRRIDAQCWCSLKHQDALLRHNLHRQANELAFGEETLGQLIYAEVAGASATIKAGMPRLGVVVGSDALTVTRPRLWRPHFVVDPTSSHVVGKLQQLWIVGRCSKCVESRTYGVRRQKRQCQDLATELVQRTSAAVVFTCHSETVYTLWQLHQFTTYTNYWIGEVVFLIVAVRFFGDTLVIQSLLQHPLWQSASLFLRRVPKSYSCCTDCVPKLYCLCTEVA